MNVPIVDNDDTIIGIKPFHEVIPEKDTYRSTGLWLTNGRGQILLAKRSLEKERYPGLWGPAVSGTVEEGESYESNIRKEAREEIGLTDVVMTPIDKRLVEGKHRRYSQYFRASCTMPIEAFSIEKKEVAMIRWWNPAELIEALNKRPEAFIPNFVERAKWYLSYMNTPSTVSRGRDSLRTLVEPAAK